MRKKSGWFIGGVGALAFAVISVVLIARSAAEQADPTSHAAVTGVASAAATHNAPLVTLYKNPTCACCLEWAEHMRANGFHVEVKEGANLAELRQELGVPSRLGSCHTAVVGGYTVEGHVPADLVRRLLAERPEIAGLAVPDMPPGVPGMPDAGPDRKPYDIVAFKEDGTTDVYATR